jgi:UDP-glucuronate decarboxylase
MRLFEGQPIIDLIVSALENKDVIVPGGEQDLTTLCYVSDMVDGLIALMGSDASVKTVNIGGDTIIKTMDVAKQIVALTGSTSTIAAGEELSFVTHPGVPDLYRVKNNLGWFPLVTLEQGLQKTIEYAVANKQALLYTHFDKLGR